MRKLLIILIVCTLTLCAGYAAYRGERVLSQKHLLAMARKFVATGDANSASLSVQQVLRENPVNVDACRLMAGFAEAARSPGALLWRLRVVELNPKSLDDRLALAQTALMLKDYNSASNALDGVTESGKSTVAYHNMAGTLAASSGQEAQAESQFLEAIRLDPQNLAPQLSLAVVRLHETNDYGRIQAHATLESLAANPTNSPIRCQALRELLIDAINHRQSDAAMALSADLLRLTNSVFSDRLLRLEVLQLGKHADYQSELAACQREAQNDPAKTYEMASWQMSRTSPADTLAWFKTMPAGKQTNQPVALMAAECHAAIGDWTGLQQSLASQNWLDLDFMRHALLALALRQESLLDSSRAEWDQALKGVNGQKPGLVMLTRLAAQWRWQAETDELLWTITTRYPGEKWAARALDQTLFVDGQTRSLMNLYRQQLQANPDDTVSKNNLAVTALLLNETALKPYDLAQQVYQKDPTNASYISTYAFSLYMQEKSAEALKVIEKIAPADLQKPSIAGYYGIILKAAGNPAKARTYLDLAGKYPYLLPEEKTLFAQANSGT